MISKCFSLNFVASFYLLPLLGLAATALEAAPPKNNDAKLQATPSAVTQAAFNAFTKMDIPRYVSFFHPDATKEFKKFAVEVFKSPQPTAVEKMFRKQLFTPLKSLKDVTAMSGSDLLITFMNSIFKTMPGIAESVKQLKLNILGTITEGPDKVHVIARAGIRPEPITCKKHNGLWCAMLNNTVMQTMQSWKQSSHAKKNRITPRKLLENMSIATKVTVIGHVKDGKETAQVLCYSVAKTGDLTISVLACYPVHKDETAWKHLNDKTKLTAALMAKWKKKDKQRFNLGQ